MLAGLGAAILLAGTVRMRKARWAAGAWRPTGPHAGRHEPRR
jgi:hypothetical protein